MFGPGFPATLVLIWISGTTPTPDALDVCVQCHGSDGMGKGIPQVPIIAGIPAEHIEEAIFAYVDGARQCVQYEEMCQAVGKLSEDEVFALADYYSSKPRRFSEADYDDALAAKGAKLHEELCAACHVKPDDDDADVALGFPLHGQRPDYLRYALETYQSGDRSSLLPAMAEKIDQLQPGDFEALVNFYASYRPD